MMLGNATDAVRPIRTKMRFIVESLYADSIYLCNCPNVQRDLLNFAMDRSVFGQVRIGQLGGRFFQQGRICLPAFGLNHAIYVLPQRR